MCCAILWICYFAEEETLRLLYVHLIAQVSERLFNYFQAMNLLQIEFVGKPISHGLKKKPAMFVDFSIGCL